MSNWILKKTNANLKVMAETLEISQVLAHILINRGINTSAAAKNFLHPKLENLHSPYLMKDMEKAVLKIISDINKPIAIYGDYDVDGVMSITILYKALKKIGANVIHYVPHRQNEGYGLNGDAIIKLHQLQISTIITCDNGISAVKEIELANQLGIDVVVIDHHEPGFIETEDGRKDILPQAYAIVDPKQKDCTYPFKMLCAAAICYKFANLLFQKLNLDIDQDFLNELLTYASIATICDVVDLIDENRTIVYYGLDLINNTNSIGLKALKEIAGIENQKINTYHIGFVIGPCINATGRIESANLSVELFLCEDYSAALTMAFNIIEFNNKRKNFTEESVKSISEQIESSSLVNDKVLVIFNETTHESIAGIVAGKLKEKYNKPTLVITEGKEFCKGSARSIEKYNIFESLYSLKHLLEKFGGHPMAAGFSIKQENIALLREQLNKDCTLTETEMQKIIKIDSQLSLDQIDLDFAESLKVLEPCGKANHRPKFAEKNITISRLFFMGTNKSSIRFQCKVANGKFIEAVYFKMADSFINQVKEKYEPPIAERILSGNMAFTLDMVFEVGINEYNNNKNVQLVIEDLRL